MKKQFNEDKNQQNINLVIDHLYQTQEQIAEDTPMKDECDVEEHDVLDDVSLLKQKNLGSSSAAQTEFEFFKACSMGLNRSLKDLGQQAKISFDQIQEQINELASNKLVDNRLVSDRKIDSIQEILTMLAPDKRKLSKINQHSLSVLKQTESYIQQQADIDKQVQRFKQLCDKTDETQIRLQKFEQIAKFFDVTSKQTDKALGNVVPEMDEKQIREALKHILQENQGSPHGKAATEHIKEKIAEFLEAGISQKLEASESMSQKQIALADDKDIKKQTQAQIAEFLDIIDKQDRIALNNKLQEKIDLAFIKTATDWDETVLGNILRSSDRSMMDMIMDYFSDATKEELTIDSPEYLSIDGALCDGGTNIEAAREFLGHFYSNVDELA